MNSVGDVGSLSGVYDLLHGTARRSEFSCQRRFSQRIIELERSDVHGGNDEERGQQDLGKPDHRG